MKKILFVFSILFLMSNLYAWDGKAPYIDPARATNLETSSTSVNSTLVNYGTRIGDIEISSAAWSTDINANLVAVADLQASSITQNVALSSLQSNKANLASPTFTGDIVIPKISSGVAPTRLYSIGYDFVGSVATVYLSTSTESMGWKAQ